jgi:hypothetical protein
LAQRHKKSWFELLGGRALERDDVAALRVDARHHVFDRAVLAGRVERLQDHEQRVGVARVQQLLRGGELLRELGEVILGKVLRALAVLGVQPAALCHGRAAAAEVSRVTRADDQILDHSVMQLHGRRPAFQFGAMAAGAAACSAHQSHRR